VTAEAVKTRGSSKRRPAAPDVVDSAADRAAQRPEPLLVFVHVPKTAGTALTSVLKANEPGPRTRQGGNVFKGGGGVKQGVRFEGLLANEAAALDQVKFLTGHFPLGIRDLLPPDLEARYFTFLREPADRTLSHFFQIRERRGGVETPNKLGLPPLPADATVEDALERGYIHDNLQTRMLSGLPEPFGEVTDEMLEQAKRNLEDLVFVGLTERFDESLVLAKRRLGLGSILYKSPGSEDRRASKRATGRVNAFRPRGADVPDELRRAAEACNRYDIELYDHAKQLFESAPERGELDFEVDVAALRVATAGDQVDPEALIPAGFGGDEVAWRMLLSAKVALLRYERESAATKALLYELGERDPEVMSRLERLRARRGREDGREPVTAVDEIQMLARAQARARDGGRAPRERTAG
jgi:hypothetical protein